MLFILVSVIHAKPAVVTNLLNYSQTQTQTVAFLTVFSESVKKAVRVCLRGITGITNGKTLFVQHCFDMPMLVIMPYGIADQIVNQHSGKCGIH